MNKADLIAVLKRDGFSKEVVHAFSCVDREKFFPEDLREYAYHNDAFPLGKDATISQPSTIAFMLDLLDVHDVKAIVEIGSGSGYVLALLSVLAPKASITGYEINNALVDASQDALTNYANVTVVNASGKSLTGQYDRILVSAAVQNQKEMDYFIKHLSSEGILVAPYDDGIVRYEVKRAKQQYFPGFVFVPLQD